MIQDTPSNGSKKIIVKSADKNLTLHQTPNNKNNDCKLIDSLSLLNDSFKL